MKKRVSLRRFVLLALVILMPFACIAENAGSNITDKNLKRKVETLLTVCKRQKGVRVLDLGWFTTSLLKGAVKCAAKYDKGNDKTVEAFMFMKGLSGISVLYYEEAESSLREKINRKIETLMNDAELLMEVKDEGEKMLIYGSTDQSGDKVSNMALFTPSEGAFIFLKGSFNLKDIAKILENK